jgi:O-antigen/teichoic acid export membrane protein
MAETQTAYRQILKTTSLFGGVQVGHILINLVRSKILAVLLGPIGIGINGLLFSTMTLIGSLTNFGLGSSAVRSIASAFGQSDFKKIEKVTTVIRSLVWGTGLLGALLTLIFSDFISELTFGNSSYTWGFRWLSVTLLFNQLSTGQGILMRGMGKVKLMAKNSFYGALAGFGFSLPLFFWLKIDGIVPAIIISSLVNLAVCFYYSQEIKIQKNKISLDDIKEEGIGMLKLGFALSLSGLLSLSCFHLLRIYITQEGSLSDLGLYSAGFTIINSYVGMVFTAMSTDFFPKLSKYASSISESNKLINQQSEIAVLILTPLLAFFILFMPFIIEIIYSKEFLALNKMIQWAALGILLKAGSWAVGYRILAAGDGRRVFWNELIFNIYALFLNVLGYYFGGLEGLGLSFFISNLFYFIQIKWFVSSKYEFHFSKEFIIDFCILFIFLFFVFWSSITIDNFSISWVALMFFLLILFYSILKLSKVLGLNLFDLWKS